MADIQDLWLFIVSGLLLNLTPGPDTAYIVARSLQRGWPGGAAAALGIGAGTFVHILASTVGLSALIATSALAFSIVKLGGAAYLLYTGWRLLTRPQGEKPHTVKTDRQALSVIFRQGFFTNALNPKVALFFLAFLPQFIAPSCQNPVLGLLILGLIFNINSTLWNLSVAACAARLTRRGGIGAALGHRIEQAIGGVFLLIGLRLAFTAKP